MAKQLSEFAHPEYINIQEEYRMIRDCFNGSKAIKTAGTLYLPSLGGQETGDYDNYKRRALFFPITSKTVATLVGFTTSKDPETEYDDTLKPYFTDGVESYQFTEFYIRCLQEVILMGRIGTLVDAPVSGASEPILVTYDAEHIINWGVYADGSLEWVLLRETIYVPDAQKRFFYRPQVQYRWCGLVGGAYTVQLLDDDLNITSAMTPLFRGRSINYVPFTCFGTSGVQMPVDKPPMLDIATINISHYMTSADLEWGRHFVGLPTPVIIGADSSTSLKIGGTAAWVLPNEGSDAKYLEFLGQGLGSLENALKEKIGLMASMSARLVDSSSKGSEAAETVRLRYMSETASLKQLVLSTETGLNMTYSTLAKVMDVPPPSISLNKDFLTIRLEAAVLRELFTAYLNGEIDKATLVYNLKRSEYLDPTIPDDQQLEGILTPVQIADLKKPIPAAPAPAKPQPQ
jgi:hypothetical protein